MSKIIWHVDIHVVKSIIITLRIEMVNYSDVFNIFKYMYFLLFCTRGLSHLSGILWYKYQPCIELCNISQGCCLRKCFRSPLSLQN